MREIPMNKELLAMVKPLIKVVNTDFYVLTNEEKPTEPRTYRNYYHLLMKRLDIPRLKYHGLRHSFATRCIESNCDYKTVSVLLGHANITTTLDLCSPEHGAEEKVYHQDVHVFGKITHYIYRDKRVCSRPLKSPFLRDCVQVQYLAYFLKHAQRAFIALLKLYAAAERSTFTASPTTPL